MISGCATPEATARFARSSKALNENYRVFNGLTISNVGVGTYLGAEDTQTDAAVQRAVSDSVRAGMNVVDTAINYRSQRAERSVGKAVSDLASNGIERESLFVSTKSGYVSADSEQDLEFWPYVTREYVSSGLIGRGEITPQYHCASVKYLEDQLARSRRNLGLECIDLAYLHNYVEGQSGSMDRDAMRVRLSEIFDMYELERKKGRIKYYGMATWESLRAEPGHDLFLALDEVVSIAEKAGGADHGFRFVQLPFNLYYDQALLRRNHANNSESALESAGRLGVGVFVSVPLMQGRLLQPGVMPEFGDMPPNLRALQFVRSAPAVVAPLVGHKDPGHVSDNCRVMGAPPMSSVEFESLVAKLVD